MFAANGMVYRISADDDSSRFTARRYCCLRGELSTPETVTFAVQSNDQDTRWECIGGGLVEERRTAMVPIVLVFVSIVDTDKPGPRKISVGRLSTDEGTWLGLDVEQEIELERAPNPSRTPSEQGDASVGAVSDFRAWIGDGPTVCVHASGKLLVLAATDLRAGDSGGSGGWRSCVLALPGASSPSPGGFTLLFCGEMSCPGSGTGGARRSWLLLSGQQHHSGDSVLHWVCAEAANNNSTGLRVELPRKHMLRLPPEFCNARCTAACWEDDQPAPHTAEGVPAQYALDKVYFLGLATGHLLKVKRPDAGRIGSEASSLRLVRSCQLGGSTRQGSRSALATEPIVHLRLTVLESDAQSSGHAVAIVTQLSCAHVVCTSTLRVLKTIPFSWGGAQLLVDRYSPVGWNELLVIRAPVQKCGEFVSAHTRSAPQLDEPSNTGGKLLPFEWHTLGHWNNSTVPQGTSVQGTSAQGTSAASGAAVDAFSSSLQRRVDTARQTLSDRDSTLVEKHNLCSFTRSLILHLASDIAAGGSSTVPSPTPPPTATSTPMAVAGLHRLLPLSRTGMGGASASEPMCTAPAFAGQTPRRCVAGGSGCDDKRSVKVVAVRARPVDDGGTRGPTLCLLLTVQNCFAEDVGQLAAAVLPWPCTAPAHVHSAQSGPLPLPSISSGVDKLSSGATTMLQLVVNSQALLGLGERIDCESQACRIGEPLETSSGDRLVEMSAPCHCSLPFPTSKFSSLIFDLSFRYIALTWMDLSLSKFGGRTARGFTYGPIRISASALLRPSKPSCPPNEISPLPHVGLEHISLLLVKVPSVGSLSGEQSGLIKLWELVDVIGASSRLQPVQHGRDTPSNRLLMHRDATGAMQTLSDLWPVCLTSLCHSIAFGTCVEPPLAVVLSSWWRLCPRKRGCALPECSC
jgi:hypothetical protein